MFIGDFYLFMPEGMPTFSMTTWYFVAFVLAITLIAYPFKSKLRPYALLLADIIFILSFSLYDLIAILIIATLGYIFATILHKKKNKYLLAIFIISIIGILLFYKYHRFILDGVYIMPLGLSFYSFKIMAYLIDLYRDNITHRYNPLYYYNYILFFPTITAGPINRPKPFIEELDKALEFDYVEVKNGAFQMVLGIFEKIVFCDFVGLWVSNIFSGTEVYGINLIFGIILYSFEIYLDFDSVSNIAIGCAKVFGFNLPKNFNSPYLASSLKDFWRRWHISLSSWFKDYLYIPLGGSRKGKIRQYINILIVFIVSGAWHGSTLNYLIWGLGHGLGQILEDLIKRAYLKLNISMPKVLGYIAKVFGIIFNFILVSSLWLIFRFTSLSEVGNIISKIGISQGFDYSLYGMNDNQFKLLIIILVVVIILDILRNKYSLVRKYSELPFIIRWLGYICLIVIFMIFGVYGGSFAASDFIYQFF